MSTWGKRQSSSFWDRDDDFGFGFGGSRRSYSYKPEKKNIIDPDLDWWTANDLNRVIERHVGTLDEHLRKIYKSGAIPKDLIEDVFKNYYYHPEDIVYINLDKPELGWKMDVIDKTSNYYLKTMTRGNQLYSAIMAKNVTTALLKLIYQHNQQGGDDGQGNGSLQGALGGLSAEGIGGIDEKTIEAAVEDAALATTQEAGDIKKSLGDMVGGEAAGKMAEDIKTYELLKEIDSFKRFLTFSPATLSKFVKGCYKNVANYYNANSTTFEESFIDADEILELEDIELLLPVFRNANLPDLTVKAHTHSFKFDIYLDASGSMSDRIHVNGTQITLYDLCRYVAIKLHSLGLIKDIYIFDGSVKKVKDVFHLMTIGCGGGTDFNNVLSNIKKTKMSSVILTDMQDHIGGYVKEAYFIGMETFVPQGEKDVLNAYAINKQFVKYAKNNFSRPVMGKDY
jgi:hypothetical protein